MEMNTLDLTRRGGAFGKGRRPGKACLICGDGGREAEGTPKRGQSRLDDGPREAPPGVRSPLQCLSGLMARLPEQHRAAPNANPELCGYLLKKTFFSGNPSH